MQIAGAFREPKKDLKRPDELGPIAPAEAMLAYVAITRAKITLDRTGVAWIEQYTGAARHERR